MSTAYKAMTNDSMHAKEEMVRTFIIEVRGRLAYQKTWTGMIVTTPELAAFLSELVSEIQVVGYPNMSPHTMYMGETQQMLDMLAKLEAEQAEMMAGKRRSIVIQQEPF